MDCNRNNANNNPSKDISCNNLVLNHVEDDVSLRNNAEEIIVNTVNNYNHRPSDKNINNIEPNDVVLELEDVMYRDENNVRNDSDESIVNNVDNNTHNDKNITFIEHV